MKIAAPKGKPLDQLLADYDAELRQITESTYRKPEKKRKKKAPKK